MKITKFHNFGAFLLKWDFFVENQLWGQKVILSVKTHFQWIWPPKYQETPVLMCVLAKK